MLPARAGVDLGVIAMKGYSTFLKALAFLEPQHQITLFHIRTLVDGWGGGEILSLCRDIVGVFYSAPGRLGKNILYKNFSKIYVGLFQRSIVVEGFSGEKYCYCWG